MDFRSALFEVSDLMSLASQSLRRVSEHEMSAAINFDVLLAEMEILALRLREIGEGLSPARRRGVLEQ